MSDKPLTVEVLVLLGVLCGVICVWTLQDVVLCETCNCEPIRGRVRHTLVTIRWSCGSDMGSTILPFGLGFCQSNFVCSLLAFACSDQELAYPPLSVEGVCGPYSLVW